MLPAAEWQAADWQRLWLSIWGTKRPWRSLALLPAGPGTPPDVILQLAISMAKAGNLYVRKPIQVADASGVVHHRQMPSFSDELAPYMNEPALVILALPALKENASSLALAKAADCALLCILRGQMVRADAKKTVAQVGAQHFIGSALFDLASDQRNKSG